MRLCYVIDHVFQQTPDGRVWTDTSFDASYWLPCLEVYSALTLVARVQSVQCYMAGWKLVEAEGISVACMPYEVTDAPFAVRSYSLRAALRTAFAVPAAVLLRMPSDLGRCAAEVLERMGRAYALEVVGDPSEALAPGVLHMQGRALLRQVFTRAQLRMSLRAVGVSYVARTFANRYPADPQALELISTGVRLESPWLIAEPRRHATLRRVKLLTIANLAHDCKGIDVLLRAVLLCRQRGLEISLTVVGSGPRRDELEQTALRLGLAPYITFAGSIAWGKQLMTMFDRADLFILPARAEGMPCAVLEAMARGLPVLATRVGALPEILPECDTVPAGSANDLAERLVACAANRAELDAMSQRNLATARAAAAPAHRQAWIRFHQGLMDLFVSRAGMQRAA